MSKIGLMTFATTLMLTGVSDAAEEITLICKGTYTINAGDKRPVSDTSLIFDLDSGTVTSSLRDTIEFKITKVSDNTIEFKRMNREGEGSDWDGKIDRISGSADLTSWVGGMTDYHLTCKPAKPLF